MTVAVDIADRLYDYTDEEKAAEAVAEFQTQHGLTDHDVIGLWDGETNELRTELERIMFEAVDANGSVKRAREAVPGGITLSVGEA